MGTKLNTRKELEPTPLVNVRGEINSMFKGTLLKSRTADMAWGKGNFYEFKVIDSTMPFLLKQVDGTYKEVNVKAGSEVSVLANTRLHTALQQAQPGQNITIVYLGLGKRPKKGGNQPHEYSVEAE